MKLKERKKLNATPEKPHKHITQTNNRTKNTKNKKMNEKKILNINNINKY
jgi:hypothetical protein